MWPWPTLFPGAKKSFKWATEHLALPTVLSQTRSYTHREHKVFTARCFRGHTQTYSLLPYLNSPYHLSSSNAFMSQRWLNKNAEGWCRPWPLTSLKHSCKYRANNYLSSHGKCSARQRSWLTCDSLPIFSHPMSCARPFNSKLLQAFILGQKWPALSLSNRETLKWSNHLCFSNHSVHKNTRISRVVWKWKNYWALLQHTVFLIRRLKTNWAYNIKANVNIIRGPQMWKRKNKTGDRFFSYKPSTNPVYDVLVPHDPISDHWTMSFEVFWVSVRRKPKRPW